MPPAPRFLRTAARWPLGIGLTSWRYMWRTTPTHRRERPGALSDHMPPAAPEPPGDRHRLQPVEDGVGALLHRRYHARISGAEMTATELIARLGEDPNRVSPSEFARFEKVRGASGRLAVGDEFVVRMPGPWDGPVRVVGTTATSYRLATLDGHLEAGQIEFSAADGHPMQFTIESWARSGDRLSEVLYDRLRMSKEVQFHMWVSYLERIVELTGGRREGAIDVDTRRVAPQPPRHPPFARADVTALLADLADRPLNFDLARRAEYTRANGWHIDAYCQPLAGEAPGEPLPDGAFAVATRLLHDYEFPDPDLVRGIYDREGPLEGRDMLLEVRWHGLRLHAGVRVGERFDERAVVEGREVQVSGWNYRTLEGHFEMGQMDYAVWKWLDSGRVEFRIHAFARAARTGNPILRLGFALIGRREQVRFAKTACRRMAQLVTAELRGRGEPVPSEIGALTVAPAADLPALERKLSDGSG
ncbi:MAG: DUF1990 family protein [Solirubrobacterales bacterium]|nr:DUF1990 family protein [Solirubrobacterales bacterium]